MILMTERFPLSISRLDADDSYDGLDAVSYYIQELKEVDAFIGSAYIQS